MCLFLRRGETVVEEVVPAARGLAARRSRAIEVLGLVAALSGFGGVGCSESPPPPVPAPRSPLPGEAPSEARPASSGSAAAVSAASASAQAPPATSAEVRASGAKSADAKANDAKLPQGTGAASSAPTGARIYSKARFAWIYPSARISRAWLGYVSLGGSAPLRGGSAESARVMGGAGCDAWYAVEPRGFMCAGASATLDPNDAIVVALALDAPNMSSPWPYNYGESIGTPRYPSAPTPAQQRAAEWDLEKHMAQVERAKVATSKEEVAAIDKSLVGVDFSPAGAEAPELFPFGPLVREDRKSIAIGSTVAFTRPFDLGGRTFLITSDHAILPKDRIKPYARSEFEGVVLGPDEALPLAFFRRSARPKYKRGADGVIAKTGEMFAVRSHVGLTGEEVMQGSDRFLVTREPDVLVSAADATVVKAVTKTPFELSKADAKRGGRQTWLDVSIMSGWLVAYEGLTPVFATLISPGRGGVPVEGRPVLSTASTPVGRFRIDGKFVTATMVSSTDENVVHTEVPYIQNFSGPHAFHAAYWHDAWGERKSGGCVNLSPKDAKWLFAWTEPKVPDGWYGLRATSDFGSATEVSLHR